MSLILPSFIERKKEIQGIYLEMQPKYIMKNSKQGFLPSKVPKLLHKYQENTQENIMNMLSNKKIPKRK